MKEFEQVEEELKGFRPAPPSAGFEQRLERALGDAGNVALRRVDGSEIMSSNLGGRGKLVTFALAGFGLSAAAVVVAAFLIGSYLRKRPVDDASTPAASVSVPASGVELGSSTEDDSPLNGVPNSAILTFSDQGWAAPEKREILVEAADEGIVERPDGPPARRYRYHYLDETIWKHPETNTLIRSAVPREEVLLVGLELY